MSQDRRDILAARINAVRDSAASSARSHATSNRLVAWVEVANGSSVSNKELNEFAAARLPDHMVPWRYVFVDALPKLPNGKIDKAALRAVDSAPDDSSKVDLAAPRNDAEAILTRIWADVLGLTEVSVHDDFFEVGGDSLLSIRILAKANREGLQISPELFFANPTIAEQAASAGSPTVTVAEQVMVTGSAPLLPIQHWFFERHPIDPHHWNQSSLFVVTKPIRYIDIERALQHVLGHHDALRLEFSCEEDIWRQRFGPLKSSLPLERYDLTLLSSDEREQKIHSVANELNADFRLNEGPLMRLAYFETPANENSLLLVVIHHLIVDAFSWTILLEDLASACTQAASGHRLDLPDKTSSFKQWATKLTGYAISDAAREELDYWVALSHHDDSALFSDLAAPTGSEINNNKLESIAIISSSLDPQSSSVLLQDLPKTMNAQINEALLTALTVSLCQWTSRSSVCIDVEGHGRETMFDDTDTSRTIGWLTSVFPFRLEMSATEEIGQTLANSKERFRSVPHNGIGYGVLRDLADDDRVREALRAAPNRQLCFNYMGNADSSETNNDLFRLRDSVFGATRSPSGQRAYLIDINARFSGNQLHIDWIYNSRLHESKTIQTLADSMQDALHHIVELCRGGVRIVTPSDFPLAGLGQAELDGLSKLLDDDST